VVIYSQSDLTRRSIQIVFRAFVNYHIEIADHEDARSALLLGLCVGPAMGIRAKCNARAGCKCKAHPHSRHCMSSLIAKMYSSVDSTPGPVSGLHSTGRLRPPEHTLRGILRVPEAYTSQTNSGPQLSSHYKISLSTIAHTAGPVSASIPPHNLASGKPPQDWSWVLAPSTVATHNFANAPALDVVMVPGGLGDASYLEHNTTEIEDFLIRRTAMGQLEYVLSVCTGAVHVARAGLLNGKRATTNKALFTWVASHGETYKGVKGEIEWIPSARWVENDGDGVKVWTSSGVSAGIDMMYAWLKHFYGETENLKSSINGMEYAPHQDPTWDPYSIVHNVPGAEQGRGLESCVKPVGY
jgi:putative intracellular protease/amidase